MKLHHSISGCVACLTAVCSTPPGLRKLHTVPHLDLERYMGEWRVIACVENSVERKFVDAVEAYELRDDGNIGVRFRWREKSFAAPEKHHDFIGYVSDTGTNARWKMRLFPFLTTSYVVIAVDPEYRWAAVAHPTRKFGWVLARERSLPERTYQKIMRAFEREGYDTDRFIKVPQVVLSWATPSSVKMPVTSR